MLKNLTRHGQAPAACMIGRQLAPKDGVVNIGPAVVRSEVTRFFGRPCPVQFRAQGALDSWAHALGNTGL